MLGSDRAVQVGLLLRVSQLSLAHRGTASMGRQYRGMAESSAKGTTQQVS